MWLLLRFDCLAVAFLRVEFKCDLCGVLEIWSGFTWLVDSLTSDLMVRAHEGHNRTRKALAS